MAALPAGVSERGGTAQGETLGETETETKGGREGQRGGGWSHSEEGRGGLGAEVSAIVGRQRRLRRLRAEGRWTGGGGCWGQQGPGRGPESRADRGVRDTRGKARGGPQ